MEPPLKMRDQSFVIKIWIEEVICEEDQNVWRGHITNVRTRERRYFEHLDVVVDVLNQSVRMMGGQMQAPLFSKAYWYRCFVRFWAGKNKARHKENL